jgi:hypothetical protein
MLEPPERYQPESLSFEQLVEQRNRRDRMDFMNPEAELLVMLGMESEVMFG